MPLPGRPAIARAYPALLLACALTLGSPAYAAPASSDHCARFRVFLGVARFERLERSLEPTDAAMIARWLRETPQDARTQLLRALETWPQWKLRAWAKEALLIAKKSCN